MAELAPGLASYRALADALPQIVWIASPHDGSITYVNRYWESYTGLSDESCLGRGWLACVHEADRAKTSANFDDAVSRGRESGVRFRLLAKGGAHLWCTGQFRPVFGPRGQVELFIGTILEIEDLVKQETYVRESEAGYRRIVEHATEGIWTIDQNGLTDYINQRGAEILGYTVEEMLGRSPTDFLPPERVEEAKARIEQRKGRIFTEDDIHARKKDGSDIWLHLAARPFFDESGNYRGTLGMFSEITERVRAAAQLEESAAVLSALSRRLLALQELERRDLARELHDEIGQILTAVNINLHAVMSAASPETRASLSESVAIVDRAIQQVRDMSLELRPSMLDDLGLHAALRWYIDRQAQRTGIQIHLSIHAPQRLPPDLETACFRIVQEALSDPARFARATHAWVAIDQHHGVVDLAIQDDGAGSDAPVDLFDMSERVQLLGGQIEIESCPSKGTEIRASIPLAWKEES